MDKFFMENNFKNYQKTTIQPMRPYVIGENTTGWAIPRKDKLENGGMVYVDADGAYQYVSKKSFEAFYDECEGVSFGAALEALKLGLAVRLPQWTEDVTIRAQFPDANSKMTAPYLYVESRVGLVPWKETMIELFSEDWMIVD